MMRAQSGPPARRRCAGSPRDHARPCGCEGSSPTALAQRRRSALSQLFTSRVEVRFHAPSKTGITDRTERRSDRTRLNLGVADELESVGAIELIRDTPSTTNPRDPVSGLTGAFISRDQVTDSRTK